MPSKRITITLTEEGGKALEGLAKKNHLAEATFAASLLMKAIDKEQERGKFDDGFG